MGLWVSEQAAQEGFSNFPCLVDQTSWCFIFCYLEVGSNQSGTTQIPDTHMVGLGPGLFLLQQVRQVAYDWSLADSLCYRVHTNSAACLLLVDLNFNLHGNAINILSALLWQGQRTPFSDSSPLQSSQCSWGSLTLLVTLTHIFSNV